MQIPVPVNFTFFLHGTYFADANAMSAFHTTCTSVCLEANGTDTVEIDFLPFHTGRRQCSMIFINETVGEFLYSIEAVATLPLPAHLPFKPGPHSVRISSAAAAGKSVSSSLAWYVNIKYTLRHNCILSKLNSKQGEFYQ